MLIDELIFFRNNSEKIEGCLENNVFEYIYKIMERFIEKGLYRID